MAAKRLSVRQPCGKLCCGKQAEWGRQGPRIGSGRGPLLFSAEPFGQPVRSNQSVIAAMLSDLEVPIYWSSTVRILPPPFPLVQTKLHERNENASKADDRGRSAEQVLRAVRRQP